mgnify:CR=1 FL=1
MRKFAAVFVLLFVASLSLSADIYVKSKSHTDPMTVMGQTTPATDTVQEQWIGDDVFAQVSADQSMIFNLKKNMVSIVNHKAKNYVETTLPIDMAKLLPPEAAAFAGMMKMSATVAEGSETKKIGQWNCKLYTMTMSMMGQNITTKIWASTDVGFDTAAFNAKFMGNLVKGGGRMLDERSLKEFAKIKGYQIATETSGEIMGAKMLSTTEVVEISKKNAPAGVYAPPSGYTKTTSLGMDAFRK